MSEWWTKYEGHVLSVGIEYPDENWLDFKSVHGSKLATYRFNYLNPKGLLYIFHGMHCASSDATHIAKKYAEEGYAVMSFDQEGHGKSEGSKGNIISLQDYAVDSENFIIKSKSLYKDNLPIFLLGESMGGTMCIMVSLKRPDLIKGIILMAPAIGVNPDLEPTLQKIVRFFNFCCCGSLGLKELDQTLASRNSYYQGYFIDNPDFFHGKVNARTGTAMLNGLQNLHSQLHKVRVPLILFQGGQDKIVDAGQAREFIRVCESPDKELVFYDDMYHAVFHEPEINEILEKCIEWSNKRLI